MYDRSPHQKWYVILGCDNYVNADYLLRALDQYDDSKDFWLAQFTNDGEHIPGKVLPLLPKWPKYNSIHAKLVKEQRFEWTSGGIGWFMSNSVAKAFAENIETFMDQIDPFSICYCPDKVCRVIDHDNWWLLVPAVRNLCVLPAICQVTGLLLGLLGFTITKLPADPYESRCSHTRAHVHTLA